MLKQKKSLNSSYGVYFYKRSIGLKRFIYNNSNKRKLVVRKRKAFLFNSLKTDKDCLPLYVLKIKVMKNNIFCYLLDGNTNVLLISGSAGLYNIKVSKKSMRFYAKNVLTKFFKICNKILKNEKESILFFTIHSSARLKKMLTKTVKLFFKKRLPLVAAFNPNKCFNGCRPRKRIRRKRRFFRIFKTVS